jgi:iron complex transport system substrate-binding protein
MGKTNVPVNPQRVVAIEPCSLDHALALGVKPVGTSHHYMKRLHSDETVEGIEDTGHPVDLEKVLALKPDLILGDVWAADDTVYDLLSQIAPTVIVEDESGSEWQASLAIYADALGKADVAKQIVETYYTRLEKFKTQMGERLHNIKVSAIAISPTGFDLYPESTYIGSILKDAGLPRPPSQSQFSSESNRRLHGLSKEHIPDLDGDVLLILNVNSPDTQEALKQLREDPLWLQLKAVQQGTVYGMGLYSMSCGPIAVNSVIDDLFKYLVDDQ